MPTLMEPTNLQKIEFNVTTAEGPSRVTIVTGKMSFPISATSAGAVITRTESLKALLDPTLTAGQFRRATATAA